MLKRFSVTFCTYWFYRSGVFPPVPRALSSAPGPALSSGKCAWPVTPVFVVRRTTRLLPEDPDDFTPGLNYRPSTL